MTRSPALRLALFAALVTAAGTALAQSLAVVPGGAPIALSVPAASTLRLVVDAPGEIQIDATAVGADAQLALVRDGVVVAEDSDGGEGVNARIVTFVTPGTYDVALWEWRGGALEASVTARVLAPLPSGGVLSLGAEPLAVDVPAGDSTRNASAEVSLEIATAGTYVIEAKGPTSGCDPQMLVVRDAVEIGRATDGEAESDARWRGTLEPGSYHVRVHDWINRACSVRISARDE
jgi:hypothetical protein